MDHMEEVDHGQATTIFVLGLISIIACNLLGPVALIMGNKYRKQCAEAGVPPEQLGTIGWILGIVGSVFFALALLFVGLYIFLICCIGGMGAMA